ncbi:50S ribosomal protein L6 [candidate division CPR3 bacterium 4484_211]|uniref:Large ribosomal subunit protein uL6 n=1 Tax=candidate division CPR3 bacterium 4484_211 TaxID=1968527 RepID=A0A1W9NZA7_UNCC3|nr:MAG: 50S ribosomal protein L6 [candidate division CPR3 bacterium 4484_211]
MSRIGKKPISIDEGIQVAVEGRRVSVRGPKGELSYLLPDGIKVLVGESEIKVERRRNDKQTRALHGTWRSILQNAVIGLKEGYVKELELVGLGYRAEVKGDRLILQVGFSHPVECTIPRGVNVSVEKSKIRLEGIDKHLVHQTAASIRAVRPPEPYKGTGIRYVGEVIKRKAGKAAKAVGAGAAGKA